MKEAPEAAALEAEPEAESLSDRARELGIAAWNADDPAPAAEAFLSRVPIQYARKTRTIVFESRRETLQLVTAELRDLDHIDVLTRFLSRPLEIFHAEPNWILAKINSAYETSAGKAAELSDALALQPELSDLQSLRRDDLLETASRAPVIKLVNTLLFQAIQTHASDLHLQPYEDAVYVRVRLDGVLFDLLTLPRSHHEEIVSRVKIIAHMDIAEKRLAQDGRATVNVGDRVIDLRISSVPTSFGERIVVRLLDKSQKLYSLEEVGMDHQTLARFREVISVEHGLILVTGPTGSGKSTTLYAALQEINAKERNIITLEDPIEYQLEGISQIQVSDRKGMTFASGLRSVLRQDPDIIMVGEIRDEETAVMAIQSALTGHLVFSTLHTNDAASAVTRLLDLGIEPYLVSSSTVAVLAQRLVRRVCSVCSTPRALSPEERKRWELADSKGVFQQAGEGCEACRQTGYSGRVGLFELLLVTNRVRELIQGRATAAEIKDQALREGMTTLRDDGRRKFEVGITSPAEVSRVTYRATF